MGLDKSDLFDTLDLFEARNMEAVSIELLLFPLFPPNFIKVIHTILVISKLTPQQILSRQRKSVTNNNKKQRKKDASFNRPPKSPLRLSAADIYCPSRRHTAHFEQQDVSNASNRRYSTPESNTYPNRHKALRKRNDSAVELLKNTEDDNEEKVLIYNKDGVNTHYVIVVVICISVLNNIS